MLFLAHLFIGLVFGLVLDKIYNNKNMIIFCAIGSILPDLVSVIFGLIFWHILRSSIMESIKFYSQTLALLLLFLITGLFFWKYYRSNSFLSVAAGIFLHEIADTWAFPDWNFPLFEPYLIAVYKGYFQNIILREITSVTEWIFFTSIIGITFYMITKEYSKDSEMEINRTNELFSGILGSIFIIFILFVSIAFFLFVTAF